MKSKNRTALLLRCTAEEAALIRQSARREHRTLSGYILNVIMSRIQHQEESIKRATRGVKAKALPLPVTVAPVCWEPAFFCAGPTLSTRF